MSSAPQCTPGLCEKVQLRPYPLLMVGIFAFLLALNAFGTVLVSQAPQPIWLWALNVVVITGDIAAAGYWYRRAQTD
jgi:hypothetical protein